ncbi:MAG: type secretion system secreted protein Hcp [Actinomycetota bacterium]|nr:type secretion system secreted protein Hcp [Actinomycetota bacterium]
MAFDAFLKLGDVKGGSTDAAYKPDIVVREYSFGLSNPSSIGSPSGGTGAGKASFTDLAFTTPLGEASPKLLLACASGAHYDIAVLTLRRSGGTKPAEFFKITLKTVFVSAYSDAGASSDDTPTDSITLSFGAIRVEVFTQNPSGGATPPPSSAGWDRTKNAPYAG